MRSSCYWQVGFKVLILIAWVWSLLHTHPNSVTLAYVGPGAGFAFLGSFLSLVAGLLLSAASFLL